MKTILCFGDSNTFGSKPGGGRWARDERWPGVLQERLGSNYYVIEEGLGGRTATSEDHLEGDRNGSRHLPVILHSHRPLDMVIIMLGTNDTKHRFAMLPVDIAYGVSNLCRAAQTYPYGPSYPVPKILLVSPVLIKEGVEKTFWGFSPEAVEVSKQLAPLYQKVARAGGWLFFDAASVAEASDRDKLHMEAESHRALAAALEEIIRREL